MRELKNRAILQGAVLIVVGVVGYLVPSFTRHLRWICILIGALSIARVFLGRRRFPLRKET